MDPNELKKQLDASAEGQALAMPKITINAGAGYVTTIRQNMIRELTIQTLIGIFFLSLFFLPIWQDSLRPGVYVVSMLITCSMSAGYLVHLFFMLKRTASFSTCSRKFITNFLSDLRVTLAAYEAYLLCSCILLPLPMCAFFTKDDLFEKLIRLQLSGMQIAGLAGGYLLFVAFVVAINKLWIRWVYGRHVSKLEVLQEEFEDASSD